MTAPATKAMTLADLDQDHIRGWIGRSTEAEDLVTPRLVAEYRATFGARLMAVSEGEAPLGMNWCLAPAIAPTDELGEDGHPARGGFLPPVPLPRRMWAGGAVEHRGSLRVGDRVVRRSSVDDVTFKDGRTGPLCFVTVRHSYETERGVALSERHDIVYRGADPAPGAPAGSPKSPEARQPAAPRHGDLTWRVEASPVLLFRYSAMTFNGHRIHYDQPYVTGVEGYPGLIVHGPVQGTLCLNLVATLLGAPPARFSFRNLSPLTAGTPFEVAAARRPDGTVACWTRSADGRICMEGEGSRVQG